MLLSFKLAFNKAGTAERFEGFSRETGFQGMLEASNLAQLESAIAFLSDVVVRCSRMSKETPVTTVFTKYVRLIIDSFRRNRRPEWTLLVLFCFQFSIASFKKYSVDLFGSYQNSGLRTTNGTCSIILFSNQGGWVIHPI